MSDHFDDTGPAGRAWFKPLVALWFAALAAAGMWFMPPEVHGAILSGTGLSSLHPLLALPVSRSGLIALCAGAGLFGLLIGLVIAGRVAAAGRPRGFAPGFARHDGDSWETDEPLEEPRRRRVFSAREDIGEDGIAISAPVGSDDNEEPYEHEYIIEDIPQIAPEDAVEPVDAGLDSDYGPPPEDRDAAPIDQGPVGEYAEYDEVADYAEVADPSEAPVPDPAGEQARDPAQSEARPTPDPEPLGDMSLDALVGRLGSALDQHRRLVAGSEEAARDPAPRPIPMTREPDHGPTLSSGSAEPGLAEFDEDDPVIAFLRREASRRMPAGSEMPREGEGGDRSEHRVHSQADAQAALRSALDRLGKANRGES